MSTQLCMCPNVPDCVQVLMAPAGSATSPLPWGLATGVQSQLVCKVSLCAKSALLVCSCDPGSGCCGNSYIVRRSCQKLFWHLSNCLGSWSGPCSCSLPEFSLLTCPGFVWRSGLCLILTQPNFLSCPCCDTLGLHPM